MACRQIVCSQTNSSFQSHLRCYKTWWRYQEEERFQLQSTDASIPPKTRFSFPLEIVIRQRSSFFQQRRFEWAQSTIILSRVTTHISPCPPPNRKSVSTAFSRMSLLIIPTLLWILITYFFEIGATATIRKSATERGSWAQPNQKSTWRYGKLPS